MKEHPDEKTISDHVARVQQILADEATEPPRHLTYDELAAWVDGTERSAAAEEHLAECDVCSAEVADLERLRESMEPRRNWIWYALAAAAALAVVIALTVIRRPQRPSEPPPVVRDETAPQPAPKPPERVVPQPPAYARAEWAQLVASALASGRLSYPSDLAILRGGTEHVRGGNEGEPVTPEPTGVVVDETRPELRWPATAGATYGVSIFDGDKEVAHSEPLTARRWRPPQPLARGRTYTWQVEVRSNGTTTVLPAPPAPPARFRIASERDHDEIAAARVKHPNDHLLLATLYATAGMEAEAKEELRKLGDSSDPRVRRLRARELDEN